MVTLSLVKHLVAFASFIKPQPASKCSKEEIKRLRFRTTLKGPRETVPGNRGWLSPAEANQRILLEHGDDLLELHVEIGMRKGSFGRVGALRRP